VEGARFEVGAVIADVSGGHIVPGAPRRPGSDGEYNFARGSLGLWTQEGFNAVDGKPIINDGSNGQMMLFLAANSDMVVGDTATLPVTHSVRQTTPAQTLREVWRKPVQHVILRCPAGF
jgi:hypothetical protein